MVRLRLPLFPLCALLLAASLLVGCTDVEDEAEPLGEADPGEVIAETDVDQVRYFTDWDTNDDTYLTRREFASGFETTTLWEDWDVDNDALLSEDEYNTVFGTYGWHDADYYGSWDANENAMLDEDEWVSGIYQVWDADGDSLLSVAELDVEVLD